MKEYNANSIGALADLAEALPENYKFTLKEDWNERKKVYLYHREPYGTSTFIHLGETLSKEIAAFWKTRARRARWESKYYAGARTLAGVVARLDKKAGDRLKAGLAKKKAEQEASLRRIRRNNLREQARALRERLGAWEEDAQRAWGHIVDIETAAIEKDE